MDDDLFQAVAGLSICAIALLLAWWAAILLVPLAILVFIGWLIHYKLNKSPKALERKAREHLHALYQDALEKYKPADLSDFACDVIERLPERSSETIVRVGVVGARLYEDEHYHAIPEPPLVCHSVEGARWQDMISKITAIDEEQAKEILTDSFSHVVLSLPHDTSGTLEAIPEPDPEVVLHTILPFFRDDTFSDLKKVLVRNQHEASGVPLHENDNPKLLFPPDYQGENVPFAFLKDTRLLELFDLSHPYSLPLPPRFEHLVACAGTGQGKSTLLQHLVLADLKSDRSVVVIDSQGKLIPELARLKIDKKVIVLDPRDNPTLNVFDIGEADEQTYNQVLEVFNYLFNSLLGADLTTKQTTLFNYIIALMLQLPTAMGRTATLMDVMHFMEDQTPYAKAIEALDPIPKKFFAEDFPTKTYTGTKEQIRYRLQAILGNKALARLFLAPKNTVNLFEELNSGSVILIDTSKAFLADTQSSYMGKVAMALVLNAIVMRTGYCHDTMVYVDEAAEVFDKSIDKFLTEARKKRAGLSIFFQYLGQLPQELRASVESNTSIKLAGGVSDHDARIFAREMRTTPEFILSQPKLQFACYIKNEGRRSIRVPIGILEEEEQMTDEEYAAFRAENRERVTSTLPQEEPPEPPDDAEDPLMAASEWD